LTLAATGVVIGIAGALALSHVLSSLLFGVVPTDPLTFVTAALACWIPARRATRILPMAALRQE
jgi:ABC-type antimicrobial peptide transport system permease subunit